MRKALVVFGLEWLTIGLIGLFLLVLIGIIIIIVVSALLFLLPAALVALIVWFITNDKFLAGIAFLVIAALAIIKR